MNEKQFPLGRADMVPQLGVSVPPMLSPPNHLEIRSPNHLHGQSGRSPGTSGQIGASSPRKRKLTLTEVAQLRRKVSENEGLRIVRAASRYAERCAVRCYLGGGGSPAEYPTWRNRLPPAPLVSYLIANSLDSDNPSEDLYSLLRSNTNTLVRSSPSTPSQDGSSSSQQTSRVPGTPPGGSSVPSTASSSSTLPHERHHIKSPLRLPVSPYRSVSSSPVKHEVSGDISPSSNQEHIVERARQEAYVMQRIAELQRDGLWSEKRVPKLQEMPRPKSHWDYLLEEMVWLAADFAQERMWKKAAAKKCAHMVQRYFREKEEAKIDEMKVREAEQRRVASLMAREVKHFWCDIEKLADVKQKTISEERKKLALRHHLNSFKNPSSTDVKINVESTVESVEDRNSFSNEVLTLQKESQLPLDTLIGNYLKVRDKLPGSSSDSSENSCDETLDTVDDEEHESKKSSDINFDIEETESKTDSVNEDYESYEESSSDECTDVDLSASVPGDRSFNQILQLAEDLEPKGNTLQENGTINKVPLLLKRKLREYQQVGFDWLVGLYDNKLNGILGDESGLGKMVQTIALLAHLACDKSNWGPHLLIVPTSEVYVWETEVKKCCPGLKVLGYYGSMKERRLKRSGWTRPNSFHVCITSYKVVIEDHLSFRRKKWKYLILDEAQYVKNLSSPRWQLLNNLRVQRKLLLIGKLLDRNQYESFSEFLLPEGCSSLNQQNYDKILKHLSLSRSKNQVQEQLPQYREHFIKCHLSNRQKHFYDDFMKKEDTMEKLISGNVIDILRVLVDLKKICNHPDLFENQTILSPFHMEGLNYTIPSIIMNALKYDPFKNVSLLSWNCLLANLEGYLSAFVAHRARRFKTEKNFITEIDSTQDSPQCPRRLGGIKISVQKKSLNSPLPSKNTIRSPVVQINSPNTKISSSPKIGTSPIVKATVVQQNATSQGVTLRLANPIGQIQNYFQIVGQQGKIAQTARLAHIVNTPAGKQILISPHQLLSSQPSTVVTSTGQRLTVVSKQGVASSPLRPLLRLPPLAVASNTNILIGTTNVSDVAKIETNVEESTKLHENGNSKEIVCNVKEEMPEVENSEQRREKLQLVYKMNELRCGKLPVYGSDVISVLSLDNKVDETNWLWSGSAHCTNSLAPKYEFNLLPDAILSVDRRLHQMKDILSRYVMCIPKVHSSPIKLNVNKPMIMEVDTIDEILEPVFTPLRNQLYSSNLLSIPQFPNYKSIQYNCGKLRALDELLKRLKHRRCRPLIFVHSVGMLDILEIYMKCKGYIYIRLDSSIQLDRRQIFTEIFNNDNKVFCLISSTRSIYSGINVTGADSIIFYDNDLNPSMESEAVAQCQRIRLAHEVEIYRLISEQTVEEFYSDRNIQKRILRDLSQEGNDLNHCYFKTSTIQDLFDVNISELKIDGRSIAPKETLRQISSDSTSDEKDSKRLAESILESALSQVEDESDVLATLICKNEKDQRLTEFDEDGELIETSDDSIDSCRKEFDLDTFEQDLSGVEKYAMKFIVHTEEHLSQAEENWEMLKRGWEITRLEREKEVMKLKRGDSTSEDEELTYSGADARCPDWVTKFGLSMPLWAPPTPPQDDNDMYIDEALCLLYEPTIIPESQLPPAYTKKDRKRSRMELNIINRLQSNKMRQKEETLVHAPRSLFDRPTPALVKMRHELRLQRYRGLMRPTVQNLLKPPLPVKPLPEPDHVPDWLIHEDWTILEALQQVQEMTVNLVVLNPGHTPNWDLVADMVNMTSRTYRSPKQCRNRYESVIMPREEGKPVPDSPKKLKKNKMPYKPPQLKSGRPLRTSQLFQQDNNSSMTQVMNCRFDAIRSVMNRRAPTIKPLLVDPTMKNNPRHADSLARSHIDYDRPLNPIEVAARRADRIAREKQLNAAGGSTVQVSGLTDQQAQLAAIRQQQLQKVNVTASGSTAGGAPRQLATLTVQEMVATVGGNRTVVSTSAIPVARTVTGEVKAVTSTGASSSPTSPSTVGGASPATAKTTTSISATQLAFYRQQRQQALLKQQQLKLLKTQQAGNAGGGGTPPKMSIAVTPPQSPVTTTLPRMQQVVVKSSRAVTESEMVALLKRQQAAKVASSGQGTAPATLTTAQILTSIQVKALNSAAAAASASGASGETTTAVLPQQVKQFQQQLLAAAAAAQQRAGTKIGQQKVTQFGQVATKMAGGGTQLIVQSGHKTIPTTVTVQNLQQVMKQVRPGHVVVAGPGRSTTIPGTVSLDGRQILAGALKTSQQAILTQVSAVLPAGTSRAQTPLVSAPLITIPPPTNQSPSHSTTSSDPSTSQHH